MSIVSSSKALSYINRTQLQKLKINAMRAGLWYKSLPRIDRVLFDLTIKVTKNVHSLSLAKSILTIVNKLEERLESSLCKSIRLNGYLLAKKISSIAQKLGNPYAKNWALDKSFIMFLGAMCVNK